MKVVLKGEASRSPFSRAALPIHGSGRIDGVIHCTSCPTLLFRNRRACLGAGFYDVASFIKEEFNTTRQSW